MYNIYFKLKEFNLIFIKTFNQNLKKIKRKLFFEYYEFLNIFNKLKTN